MCKIHRKEKLMDSNNQEVLYDAHQDFSVLSLECITIFWTLVEKYVEAIYSNTVDKNCYFKCCYEDIGSNIAMNASEVKCTVAMLYFLGFIDVKTNENTDILLVTIRWNNFYRTVKSIINTMLQCQDKVKTSK